MNTMKRMTERGASALALTAGRANILAQDRMHAERVLEAALPAYIELQKRLALAEAKLEAVRKYVEDDSFDSFYRKHLLPILDDQ